MENNSHSAMVNAANAAKCAHPICSCRATSGKFCSIECAAMEKTPDIDCRCEHTDCKGHTH